MARLMDGDIRRKGRRLAAFGRLSQQMPRRPTKPHPINVIATNTAPAAKASTGGDSPAVAPNNRQRLSRWHRAMPR